MQKPEIDRFIPFKIKIQKSLGLLVKWYEPRQVGEAEYRDGFEKESQNQPHPDLINLMTDMVEPLRSILITDFENIRIVELDISGESANEAMKIKAEFKFNNGQKSTVTTHFIKLNEDNLGVESKMWALLENIKTEVYEYVFSDKYAQLSLFAGDSEPEEEGVEENENPDTE